MTELPPESVLRLARALGLEEFLDVLGWKISLQTHTGSLRVEVPVTTVFPTVYDLHHFCALWNIPLTDNEKRQTSLKTSPWAGMWSTRLHLDKTYPLYIDNRK